MEMEGIAGVVVELVTPPLKRLGTVLGTVLVTYGVAAEHANLVVSLVGASAAIAVDVGLVLWKRRKRNG